MSLGRSLVGALVGSAVGLAVQLGIELNAGEAPWCALVTGVATGLGVRQFDPSVVSSASYVRGALAALFALGSTFAGVLISSNQKVAQHASALAAPGIVSPVAAIEAAADAAPDATPDTESKEADEAPAPVGPPASAPVVQLPPNLGPPNPRVSSRFSPLSFALIAVGVFLAYEFARGRQAAPNADAGPDADAGPAADSDPAADAGQVAADPPADA